MGLGTYAYSLGLVNLAKVLPSSYLRQHRPCGKT